MSDNSKYLKLRKQLIGFAVLLLIFATIAPWIITDKSERIENSTDSSNKIQISHLPESNSAELTSSLEMNKAISQPISPVEPIKENSNITGKPQTEITAKSSAEKNAVPSPKKTDTSPPATSKASAPTMPKAPVVTKENMSTKKYMIQLVALKNKQKIEELTALLILHNYDVQIIPKEPKPDEIIRLQLGPYTEKEKAEQVIIDLKKLTNLEGKILTN